MVTVTLYTFVRVNIVNFFASRVILFVYDSFYWTFINTSTAVNTGICDFYCHIFPLKLVEVFLFVEKLYPINSYMGIKYPGPF